MHSLMEKRTPHRWQVLALWVFTVCAVGLAGAQTDNPAAGQGVRSSRVQLARDMRSHTVVMSVALEPGEEDLATIGILRIRDGVQVYTVYATDGAATLSDFNGDAPMRLAGRRREEACSASAIIGAEPYFLNLPDIGVVDEAEELSRLWISDTLEARLARALLYCRPDVILLNRDFRDAPGQTLRQSVLLAALEKVIRQAGGPLKAGAPEGEMAWKTERVFIDRGDSAGGLFADASKLAPSLRKSCREIARQAAAKYQTLRGVMSRRTEARSRVYNLAYLNRGKAPRTFLEGLPLVSPRVQGMFKAALAAVLAPPANILALVSQSIDEAQFLLIHERASLTPVDVRACTWAKNTLEDLRCRLLDVHIAYHSSDSLLTERQVFYLTFSELKAGKGPVKMEIVFPKAMDKSWWINETEDFRFPLNKPQRFTIVTPGTFAYNTPASLYGIRSELPRVEFPFIIFHEDSVRARNFAFQGRLKLKTGPRRALEILTPVVRAYSGEVLLYSMLNISRNVFEGEIQVRDSVVLAGPMQLRLPSKDFLLTDTLSLRWNSEIPDGDYNVDVKINGENVARFTAKKFPVAADSSALLGLFTGIQSSQVEATLRRMHVPCVLLDSSMVNAASLAGIRTVLIDRDALALRSDASKMAALLEPWVREGGHLVVLPQFESAGAMTLGGIGFNPWPALPPESLVQADPASGMLRTPNMIGENEWKGWVVARAFGSLRLPAGENVNVAVSSSLTGAPLVADVAKGKGRITAVALDLISQMMNVHPGSFRLLANLVAGR